MKLAKSRSGMSERFGNIEAASEQYHQARLMLGGKRKRLWGKSEVEFLE
jgi:hypothetical protein